VRHLAFESLGAVPHECRHLRLPVGVGARSKAGRRIRRHVGIQRLQFVERQRGTSHHAEVLGVGRPPPLDAPGNRCARRRQGLRRVAVKDLVRLGAVIRVEVHEAEHATRIKCGQARHLRAGNTGSRQVRPRKTERLHHLPDVVAERGKVVADRRNAGGRLPAACQRDHVKTAGEVKREAIEGVRR
jgi:hypothetical protein